MSAGNTMREPAHPNGARAEMTEIGVHRLAARHHEHERAERHEDAMGFRLLQEGEGVNRVEGVQDLGMQLDLPKTKHGKNDEPDNEDRTEDPAHASRSLVLNGKQKRENDNRNGDDRARRTSASRP